MKYSEMTPEKAEKMKAYAREYAKANHDKLAKYREQNREKHRDYQREWRKRNPDYFKKWRAKEKAGQVKEKPEGFRHVGGVFTVDRCPICKTVDIGKIGKNNYYCPRCAVEFNAQHCWSITREGVRVREW